MSELKRLVGDAFAELERESVHPSDEEIAAAVEGSSGGFAMAEIRGHLGWCARCQKVAEDFRMFGAIEGDRDRASEDAAWQAMRQRIPAPLAVRGRWRPEWLSAAAGFALCAVGVTLWFATRPPAEVIVDVPKPQLVADAAIRDLYPVDGGVRSHRPGEEPQLPTPPPRVLTLILHPPDPPTSVSATVTDGEGREVGSSELRRQEGGAFTVAVSREMLQVRPLGVELTYPDGARVKFVLP